MAALASKKQVLQLYRELLRVARAFPERSMGKKLQYNTRELIRLRRNEASAAKIQQFVQEGYDTLRMYQTLQSEPTLLDAITRKKNEEDATRAETPASHLHTAPPQHQQQQSSSRV